MSRVLVTGGTGHVGSAVLIKALREGYSVKAAVRSIASSKDKILQLEAIRSDNLGAKLSFVEVPDILAPTAYTEAIKDVDFVIHVASPIPLPHLANTNLTETVVNPAIRGTLNILEAALSNVHIKRVVITSSVVANSGGPQTKGKTVTPDTREPVMEFADLRGAYPASKHAALLASDQFMEERTPHFDLINIMPGYVIGPKALAGTREEVLSGSNAVPFALLLGGPTSEPIEGATVHLEDVATVHVDALKLPGKTNRSFGVLTPFNPNDVFAILKKHFPRAIAKGDFKEPSAPQPFHYMDWDASATEKTFGFAFKGVEEQVVSVAAQYLATSAS